MLGEIRTHMHDDCKALVSINISVAIMIVATHHDSGWYLDLQPMNFGQPQTYIGKPQHPRYWAFLLDFFGACTVMY